MKDNLSTIAFLVLCLIFLVGCDGDDGDQAAQDISTDTEDSDEAPKPEIVLESGAMTVPGGSGVWTVCKVYPPSAGTLRGTLMWDSPPDQFKLRFRCADTDTDYPIAAGASPLAVEEHVSESWQTWILYVATVTPQGSPVSYVVMFRPD